jgi:hypothetical protein
MSFNEIPMAGPGTKAAVQGRIADNRRHRCDRNARIESFFPSGRRELLYASHTYPTRERMTARSVFYGFLLLPSLLFANAVQAQAAPPNASDRAPALSTTPTREPSAPSAPPADYSQALTPPALLPTREGTVPPRSWFYRAPYEVKIGEGSSQWKLTFYGFIEFDTIYDTTRSFNDSEGNGLVVRDDTNHNAASHSRTTFVSRNTRFGFRMNSPEVGGVTATAILEGDFFGTLPGAPPAVSEGAFYTSPDFRIRHAYLKLENDVLDVWAGQTYNLFGWQSNFSPCSLEFLGLPAMIFGRTPQVRLIKTIKSAAVNFDIAVAAVRPVQRDSAVPEGEGGLRLTVNKYKGISTPGNGGTAAFPMAIGVSGTVRQFRLDAYPNAQSGITNSATGWGVAVGALLPIIPAANSDDRSGAVTLTGEFSTGTGYGDLLGGLTGGANFPANPPTGTATTGTPYAADADAGIVTYDTSGTLHTIDWTTFLVGLQYYLPPSGRVSLSVNYSQANSKNMADLFPNSKGQFKASRYFDANVFFDVTPAARIGGSYQYTEQTYVDGVVAKNHRAMGIALYFF